MNLSLAQRGISVCFSLPESYPSVNLQSWVIPARINERNDWRVKVRRWSYRRLRIVGHNRSAWIKNTVPVMSSKAKKKRENERRSGFTKIFNRDVRRLCMYRRNVEETSSSYQRNWYWPNKDSFCYRYSLHHCCSNYCLNGWLNMRLLELKAFGGKKKELTPEI